MATVALSLIQKFVAPEVIGCPSALILNKIVTKAIQFCEESEAWRHDMTAINLVAAQPEYTLDLPAETQIIGIKSLFDEDQPISPKSEQQMDSDWPKLNTKFGHNTNANNSYEPWRQRADAKATFYYQSTPSKVRLFPIPTAAKTGGLTGTVVVKPLPDGSVIDEELYNQYFDHIAAGAKAELMAMPKKQWSNPEMVQFYMNRFKDGINQARSKEARGHQTNNNTTGHVRSYP